MLRSPLPAAALLFSLVFAACTSTPQPAEDAESSSGPGSNDPPSLPTPDVRGTDTVPTMPLPPGTAAPGTTGGAPGPGSQTVSGNFPVKRTEAEWQARLSPEQYRVMRQRGTERAFTGKWWNHHDAGAYICQGCGSELFSSEQKFDSGTGWPSYWQPSAAGNVSTSTDTSHGMTRTEVHCNQCGSHLGHVFDDGPQPTGQRFCINGGALDFRAKSEAAAPPPEMKPLPETAPASEDRPLEGERTGPLPLSGTE